MKEGLSSVSSSEVARAGIPARDIEMPDEFTTQATH